MYNYTILLVEDSQFIAKQVSDTLDTYGFSVQITQTGQAAREVLETESIDCVVINHDLPDETGVQFTQSLSDEIPIVMLTTTSLDSIAEEAITAGVTEFAHKDNLATGTMTVLANRIDVAVQATAD